MTPLCAMYPTLTPTTIPSSGSGCAPCFTSRGMLLIRLPLAKPRNDTPPPLNPPLTQIMNVFSPLFQLLPKSRVCSWDVRNVQRYVPLSPFPLPFLTSLPFSSKTDVKPLYPFLIAYGASGAATVLLCMAVILALPSAAPLSSSDLAVTASQRAALVAFYIPFIVVPALIAVDFGIRTSNALQAHAHARANKDKDRKTR